MRNMAELIKVELKEETMIVNNIEEKFNYEANLINALNRPPEDKRSGQVIGFSLLEMKKRMDILNKIKEANDFVLLEKNEFAELTKCLDAQKWIVLDQTIINFIDDVKNSEKVKVDEVKK